MDGWMDVYLYILRIFFLTLANKCRHGCSVEMIRNGTIARAIPGKSKRTPLTQLCLWHLRFLIRPLQLNYLSYKLFREVILQIPLS